MRIVYMGTPDFSVPALRALVLDGHRVEAVVTQPDKPKGRGKAVQYPPVKEAALSLGIPVLQPQRVREEGFISRLKEIAPDVIVVAAFGQILPREALALPPYGCVNIHASLLPRYRGAAPIQQAVLDGETVSGVTTMYMEEGLDTGDILLKKEVTLAPDETGGSLHDKLASAGSLLIVQTLRGLLDHTVTAVPQDGALATYTKRLTKEQGRIDFGRSACEIERQIRGLNPWPSAYTHSNGRLLKIWKAGISSKDRKEGVPGEVTEISEKGFEVQTGDGSLRIEEVQPEGKRRMSAAEFLRGNKLEKGTVLS